MGPGIVQRMGALVYRVLSTTGIDLPGEGATIMHQVKNVGPVMFFLLAVISYYLVSVIWKIILFFSEKGNRYCEVEVFFGEKNDRLRGLIDTGNTLSDTISNDPVSIIDRASVRRLTEEKKPERFRYISYHSIGKKEGVMPAFRLDKMQIIRDGNKINVEHPLVAVSEEELGSENYQMIINPDILTGGKKNGDKSGSSTSV